MMNEINHIVSILHSTFEKDAWHGPSVKEVLDKISSQDAHKKLPDTHSIIQLVTHMTSWRRYTIHKLTTRPEYQMEEGQNFPESRDWPKALDALYVSQGDLLRAVVSFPAEKLHDQVPYASHRYSFYTLLHGIIHHDLYHLGQIVLIQKAAN